MGQGHLTAQARFAEYEARREAAASGRLRAQESAAARGALALHQSQQAQAAGQAARLRRQQAARQAEAARARRGASKFRQQKQLQMAAAAEEAKQQGQPGTSPPCTSTRVDFRHSRCCAAGCSLRLLLPSWLSQPALPTCAPLTLLTLRTSWCCARQVT